MDALQDFVLRGPAAPKVPGPVKPHMAMGNPLGNGRFEARISGKPLEKIENP